MHLCYSLIEIIMIFGSLILVHSLGQHLNFLVLSKLYMYTHELREHVINVDYYK